MTIANGQLDLWVEDRVVPAVVVVAGSLVADHAPALRQVMRRLTESEGADILVDLSKVDHVDLVGLGVLAGARRRAEQSRGRVTVLSARPAVTWAMRLAGLADLIWDGTRAEAAPSGVVSSVKMASPGQNV